MSITFIVSTNSDSSSGIARSGLAFLQQKQVQVNYTPGSMIQVLFKFLMLFGIEPNN